jgi:polar amino acid transport system substrate-binding protein
MDFLKSALAVSPSGARRHLRVAFAACLSVACHTVSAATLTAGSPPTSAPTTFLDTKTGQITGIMPDLAAEVAKRSNIELHYEAIPFAGLIQSAVSGKIDMIVAGMTPTEKRARVIDFSQPVAAFAEGIIANDSNKKEYKSANDFRGEVIGILSGTDYADKVREMNVAKEIKLYDNTTDLARDVEVGRITVGMNDYPILKYQQSIGALRGVHVVESYKSLGTPEDIAFGVKKGNTKLLKQINDALTAMKADGTLQAILVKWKVAQ